MKFKHIIIGGFTGGIFVIIAIGFFFQVVGGLDPSGLSLQGRLSDLMNYLQFCFVPSFAAGAIGSAVLEKVARVISSRQAKRADGKMESLNAQRDPGIGIAILGGIVGGIVSIAILGIVFWLLVSALSGG